MRKASRSPSYFLTTARRKLYWAMFASSPLLLSAEALAGPQGGQIVGGNGNIHQAGSATTVTQSSDLITVNWDSYNLGPDDVVNYIQPGQSSMALNFILDHNASEILGQINANGHVALINPNGIVFGGGARINVGGLIASGLTVDTEDFLNGEFTFSAEDGTSGKVVNRGIIEAASGGSVTLLGREVRNEGLVSAHLGAINLAAGNQAVVTFDDMGLMGVRVTDAVLQEELGVDPALLNSGDLSAAGGRVLMTASASREVFSQAVNTGDISQARSVVMHDDGSFSLGAGADTVNTGSIDVSHANQAGSAVLLGEQITHTGSVRADTESIDAGHIELHAADTLALREQALVSASSFEGGEGGQIKLLGHQVGLFDQSRVEATGALGGGDIYMGGDYQGENTWLPNAYRSVVGPEASLDASASVDGDGGRIIVWADDRTWFYGHIAGVGRESGLGGFAEVSGKEFLTFRGTADLAGDSGAGQLLLDPTDIVIRVSGAELEGFVTDFDFIEDSGSEELTVSAESIAGFLEGDTNVVLRARRNIYVNAFVSQANANGSLTLEAGQSVGFNESVTIGGADLTVIAGHDGCGGLGCLADEDQRGISIASGQQITTTGTVNLTASDFISINGAIDAGSATLTSANDITLGENSRITTDSGDISITAGSNIGVASPPETTGKLTVRGDLVINSPLPEGEGAPPATTYDILLNASGDIELLGEASTFGGNFIVGSADEEGLRPTSFVSYISDDNFGSIRTGTDRGIHDEDDQGGAYTSGDIRIRTRLDDSHAGGHVVLGQLDISYDYSDVNLRGGAARVGAIEINAAGDFLLGHEFNFNDSGPRSDGGINIDNLKDVSFTVDAGGDITIDAQIFDEWGDQRDALNIDFTAAGSLSINDSVYSAGGNIALTAQSIVFDGNSRLDTRRARSGEFIGDNSPYAGWSTGGNVTLTSETPIELGRIIAGATEACEYSQCEGNITLIGTGGNAIDITQRDGTSLNVLGALILEDGLGDVDVRSESDISVDVQQGIGRLSVDATADEGNAGNNIEIHADRALEIGCLVANGGQPTGSGSNSDGQDGGNITVNAGGIRLYGDILSQASEAGHGNASDGTHGNITLNTALQVGSGNAQITGQDIKLNGAVNGLEEAATSLTVNGRNVTFSDTLGGAHAVNTFTVNASESVRFGGSQFPGEQAITVTGTGEAAERSLYATGGDNHWALDEDGEGTLNNTVSFVGFSVLAGGEHNDTFELGEAGASFTLDGGSGGHNTLKSAVSDSAWALSDDDAFTGTLSREGEYSINFSGIQALQGSGTDSLQARNGQQNHWRRHSANDSWLLSGAADDATDEVRFTGMNLWLGGNQADIFALGEHAGPETIVGNDGENTLINDLAGSAWILDEDEAFAGTLSRGAEGTALTFSGIQVSQGSDTDSLQARDGQDNHWRWDEETDSWLLGSAADDATDQVRFSGMNHWLGGNQADIFALGEHAGPDTIVGNGGENTLTNDLAGSAWVLGDDEAFAGTLSRADDHPLNFSDIQTLQGSGSDSLQARNGQQNHWRRDGDTDFWLLSEDGQTNDEVRFTGMNQWLGGNQADVFELAEHAGPESIVGNDGENTLINDLAGSAWILDDDEAFAGTLSRGPEGTAPTFSGIQVLQGSDTDSLQARNGQDNHWRWDEETDSWLLGSAADDATDEVRFSGMNQWLGGNQADVFELAEHNGPETIEGRGGENTLINTLADSTWVLSEEAAFTGTLSREGEYSINFSGIHALRGSGSDSLQARDGQDNHWRRDNETDFWLLSEDGEADDEIRFAGMIEWNGGNGNDRFVPGAVINGLHIDGREGVNSLEAPASDEHDNEWRLGDGETLPTLTQNGSVITFTSIGELAGAGSDTLYGRDVDAQWQLTGNGAGNYSAAEQTLAFSGMQTLVGGEYQDDFLLERDGAIDTITAQPTGAASNNSLTINGESGQTQSWEIGSDGSGQATGRVSNFSGIFNFTGSASNDSFTLREANASISIAGEGGSNSLTWTVGDNEWALTDAYAGSVGEVSFTGIGTFTGAGTDSFQGRAQDNRWYLSNEGHWLLSGLVTDGESPSEQVTLKGFGVLIGNGDDWLGVAAGNHRWEGQAGSVWELFNSGADERVVELRGMSTLVGGAGADHFIVGADTDRVTIEGGSDSGNHLDLRNVEGALIVGASEDEHAWQLNAIQEVTGNGATASLWGYDEDTTWAITDNGAGCWGEMDCDTGGIRFAQFGTLNGGSGNDDFHLHTGTDIALTINGGEGSNRLYAYDRDNSWQLGQDTQTLNATLTFTGMSALYGGIDNDNFEVSSTQLAPTLYGFDPERQSEGVNTLAVIADAGTTLQWELTGTGNGFVQERVDGFFGFNHLQGSAANDHFTLREAGGLNGSINGGDGDNRLSNFVADSAWTLDRDTDFAGALAVGGGAPIEFTGIGDLHGSGSDSLTGRAGQNNRWIVSGDGVGTVSQDLDAAEDVVDFSGMAHWIGGAEGDNHLTFNGEHAAWTITDVDGGTGGVADYTFAQMFTLVSGDGDGSLSASGEDANQWRLTGAGEGELARGGDDSQAIVFQGMTSLTGGGGADVFTAEGLTAAQVGAFDHIDGGANSAGTSNQLLLDTMAAGAVLDISLGDHAEADLRIANFNVLKVPSATEGATTFSRLRGRVDRSYHWDINGTNAGVLSWSDSGIERTLVFEGFGNLDGGGVSDTFLIRDEGNITGRIDGRGGDNSLDYSLYQGDRVIVVGGDLSTGDLNIRNISGILGNNDGSADAIHNTTLKIDESLTGNNSWDIRALSGSDDSDGVNDGQVTTGDGQNFFFVNVNHLVGGQGNDTFNLLGDGTITGSIRGGGGSNTINATGSDLPHHFALRSGIDGATEISQIQQLNANGSPDNRLSADNTGNTWRVTGDGGGTLNDALSFSGIQWLQGGTGEDVFNFSGQGRVRQIDGGEASDNRVNLRLSDRDMDVSQDADDPGDLFVLNIRQLDGNSSQAHRLWAADTDNNWHLTGMGVGSLNDEALSFTGLSALRGGDGADHFTLAAGAGVSGLLRGGGGDDNTLVVAGDDNHWYLGAASNLNGTQAFTGFQHFVGMGGDNAFIIEAGHNVRSVTGAETGANTLEIQSGAGDVLRWEVSGTGAGQAQDRVSEFRHITALVGGEGDDTFDLGENGFITGRIDGGNGNNHLLSQLDHTAWRLTGAHEGDLVQLDRGTLSWAGIQTLTGSGSDSLEGRSGQDNHWRADSTSDDWLLSQAGQNTDLIRFSGMNRWQGGNGADNFVVGGYDGQLHIDGGPGGENRLEAHGGGLWRMSETFTGEFDDRVSFTVIHQIRARHGIHQLHGSSQNNHWLLTDSYAGSLGINGSSERLAFSGISEVRGNVGNDQFVLDGERLFAGGVHGGGGQNSLTIHADDIDWRLSGIDAGDFNGQSFSGMRELIAAGENHRLYGANTNTEWVLTDAREGLLAFSESINATTRFSGMSALIGGSGDDSFTAGADLSAGAVAEYTLIDGGAGGHNTLDVSAVNDDPLDISLGGHPDDAENPLQIRRFSDLQASDQNNRLRGNASVAYQWQITGSNAGSVSWPDDQTMTFSGFAYLYGGDQGDRFTVLENGALSGAINGMGGTNLLDLSLRESDVLVSLGDLSDGELGLSISGINGIIGNHNPDDPNSFNSTFRIGSAGQSGEDYEWHIGALTDLSDLVHSDGINDGRYRPGSSEQIAFVSFNILEGSEGNDTFTFIDGGQITGHIDGVGGQNIYDASGATAAHSVYLGEAGEGVRLTGIQTLKANANLVNRLAAADDENHWQVRASRSQLNDTVTFDGFGFLVGGSQDDVFVFDIDATAHRIDGGGGHNQVDVTALDQAWEISLDLARDSHLLLENVHDLQASSAAGHILVGATDANEWRIDDANAGRVNDNMSFSGIGNLRGNQGDDDFVLVGNGSLSGRVDGAGGRNRLDLHELSAGRTLTLDFGDDEAADLALANIQEIDAPSAAAHRLQAQSSDNRWIVTGRNRGQLNDILFSGIGWLIGADGDDQFTFQRGASLTGYLDGGSHREGNHLDMSELESVSIRYGAEGDVRNIQSLLGNNRDTRLVGLGADNQWRLREGQNRGSLNESLSFVGITDLQGGDAGNTFFVDGGSVTGSLIGGQGDDRFELAIASGEQGRMILSGGEGGHNTVLVTGGGTGYSVEYRASRSADERMVYTSANDAVYELAFSNIAELQDHARTDTLRLNSSTEADALTLGDQSYQVDGLTQLTWRNTANVLVAAGSDDHLTLSGAIDVPGTLEIRNARVVSDSVQQRLAAEHLRLTNVMAFGSADQVIATDVARLSGSVVDELYLHNATALTLPQLDVGGTGAIAAGGAITSDGALHTQADFGFHAERGDLQLTGNNRFRGELSLRAENAIDVTTDHDLTLGAVQGNRMTLSAAGAVSGHGVVALESLNVQRAGDLYLVDGDNMIGRLRVGDAGEVRLHTGQALAVEAIEASGPVALTAESLSQEGRIRSTQGVDIAVEETLRMASGAVTEAGADIHYRAGDDMRVTRLAANGADIHLETGGALRNASPNSDNLEGRKITLASRNGIGADQRLHIAAERLSVSNQSGTVALTNRGDLVLERVANNGTTSLRNSGNVVLDGREGPVFDRNQSDARLAGGTVNANYDTGALSLTVTNGDLTALGPTNATQPDLVGRSGSIVVSGNIGAPGRPLVMYFQNDLFLQGLRSWPPVWAFGEAPATVDNQSTIQVNQQDLLRAGGEQMVEVESLVDIDPAIFTEVRNYFFDAISILMPVDQRYDDDDQYSWDY